MEIIGMCSACRLVYPLANGISCPQCGGSALLWASRLEDPEEEQVPWPHVLNAEGTACRWDCCSCAWLRRDKPCIDWLDHLYNLEDLR